MLKKKLQPFKRPPTNSSQSQFYHSSSLSQNTLTQVLTQLIKQQKITNQLLKNQINGSLNSKNFQMIIEDPLQKNQDQSLNILPSQSSRKQPKLLQPIVTTSFNNNIRTSKLQRRQSKMQNVRQSITNIDQSSYPIYGKKNYNILNQFLPYTDRRQYKIRIQFQSFVQNANDQKKITLKQLQKITNLWVGDVYRMVASMCWNMLLNGFLNFDQTKILFTQNIIYNYIEFMKSLEKRNFKHFKHYLTALINKTAVNTLDFLGKQFPQTKIDAPNIRLKEILPKINNSHRLKYDMITLANAKGFQIKFKKNGNYSEEIMTFVNFLIDQTNQTYAQYQKDCLSIFQQLYLPPEKRCNPNTSLKDIKFVETSQSMLYKDKVKKYTKFLIGRKISKNVPKFTRQEINNGVFYAKSPSILRVITKWVQELTDIIKKPEQHILSPDRQLKGHDGDFVTLFGALRKAVCDKIIQKRHQFFKKIDSIKQECYYIESILSSSKFIQDPSQTHLSADQISVGKYSVYLQKAISTYLFQQLNDLLNFLLEVPLLVDQKNLGIASEFDQSQAKKQLDKLNLVTMKTFDLLRCKCISNQEQIIWIMKYIMDKNDLGGDFKLIRVKDRLNEGTRDINMNVRFRKNSLLSEMQLLVVANIQKKQEQLDYYNHFLYELKRSKLGPLSQNVFIWTVLEQRASYFQKITKNPIPSKIQFHACTNDNLQKFTRPISCQSCKNFYPYPQICYSNFRCRKCKISYCGQCYSKVLDQQSRKIILFQKIFDRNVISNIVQHYDPSQPFPLEGIYLKKYVEKKQINVFTLLIKDVTTKNLVSYETIKSDLKKFKQTKFEFIFTHNTIRDGKVVVKQKNFKNLILGKFNQKGQLFIQAESYKFFKEYVLFSFNQQFKPSILSLKQIQQKLKEQENAKKKVYNIMEDPVYIDFLVGLKKKTEKIRQLFRLRSIFIKNLQQKFLVFEIQKYFILTKAYKDPVQLGRSIDYANNISVIKQYATSQNSIISIQHRNVQLQFQNLKQELPQNLQNNLMKNLRKLYLNYNNLKSVQGLKLFIGLQVLYLKHNQLTNLKGIQKMQDLMVLRIDDNKIQTLQSLVQLKSLRRLMGNKNKITSIQSITNLIGLKTIEFGNNQNLKELPQFISQNINFIALSQTSIKDLTFLSKYPKLQRVLLQNLGLKHIPIQIKDLSLRQIWLNFNQIQQLQNLQNQTQLQILSLKSNKLKSIQNIKYLQKLKSLYVDNNEIKSLKGLKVCLQTLKYVSISNYQFKRFNIFLDNNPLEDCKDLIYADDSFVIKYTPTTMSEKTVAELTEILYNKVNSSGPDD